MQKSMGYFFMKKLDIYCVVVYINCVITNHTVNTVSTHLEG